MARFWIIVKCNQQPFMQNGAVIHSDLCLCYIVASCDMLIIHSHIFIHPFWITVVLWSLWFHIYEPIGTGKGKCAKNIYLHCFYWYKIKSSYLEIQQIPSKKIPV